VSNKIVVYQAKNGAIELPIDATSETIWATQAQIADVFDVNVPAINKHVANIIDEGELETATISKKEIVQIEGNRKVRRTVTHYNLDMIIAIGYRISSGKGTAFRKWATQTLRSYIQDGYAINPSRIEYNKSQFLKAIEDMKLLSASVDTVGSSEVSDLAVAFANTWFSLNAYDKSELPSVGSIRESVDVGFSELQIELDRLKKQLIDAGEATELFATERDKGGLRALFGNILQSFDGNDIYPTVEEKAAHLLYFVVKNHVFVDGNKRSGAYAFIWFLKKANLLNLHEISPQALTVITLLVAESDPHDKDKMIGLILLLLGVSGRGEK